MGSLSLFVFAVSLTLFAVQSSDVFMYLALARDFVLKGNWSVADPYLYSLPNAQLVWMHEYLSYLAFHAAHEVAGTAGLVLLKAVLLSAIFLLVLMAPPKLLDEKQIPWIALWVLAATAASFRFIERSSLFSDLFCVLSVKWLLESQKIDRRFLTRFTILMILWIQFHPGFPIGLCLLGLWGLWHLIFNPQTRLRDLPWLAIPAGALLLNPLGLEGVLYPFKFAMNEARTLKHFNFEWFPGYHPAFRLSPEVVAFWILTVVCLALITRENAWKSLRAWFMVAAFAFALSAVRFVPWSAFAMILAVKPWGSLKLIHPPPFVYRLLMTGLIFIGVKNLTLGYQSSSGYRRPGFKLDPAFFPIETLEFLRKTPIPGRVYNTHDYGAYMVWKGYSPIFHHGFVTDMEFYRNDVIGVFESQRRFLELAKKHGWTMLLVEKHNSYAYFWKILSPLPEWKIVAEDGGSYLIYRLPDAPPN